MRLSSITLSKQQQTKYNTTFNAKGIHNPQKLLTDNTMKVISTAIASLGIAGVALQKETADFANTFDKEISKSGLKKVDTKTIAEVMETTPILIDIILTDKNNNNSTRNLTDNTLKSLVETYYKDAELTESLLTEKDKKGDYKYTAHQINTLVKIKNETPELYELARKNPSYINSLLEMKNQYDNETPLYGTNDIILWNDASKINPKLTEKLIKQRNMDGNPRFSGEQVKYMVKNFNEANEFTSFLINAKYGTEKDNYYFTPEQIIEMEQLVKDKLAQKVVKKLSQPITYKNIWREEVTLQLPSKDVVKIVKNPDLKFTDLYNEFDYIPELLLEIYHLINGKIDVDELDEILSIKNETCGRPVFRKYDLSLFPELFTKNANKKINESY